MNIKGLGLANINPLEGLKKTERQKMSQTQDRDPGNQHESGKEPEQHRLTEEQVKEAIEKLKKVPGVLEVNFQFRIEKENDRFVVFVEELGGKVIRRMSDNQLWSVLQQPDKETTGNLLNRAA